MQLRILCLAYRSYVAPNKPAIFRGAASHWPAVGKWTDEYLRYIRDDYIWNQNFLTQTYNIYFDNKGAPCRTQRWRWPWLRTGTRTRSPMTRGCSSCRSRRLWPWTASWVSSRMVSVDDTDIALFLWLCHTLLANLGSFISHQPTAYIHPCSLSEIGGNPKQ